MTKNNNAIRVQAFDGLRACAIAMVLLYHASTPFSQGGFIGVDIFFVLSGFLISTLIVREIGLTNKFNFFSFLKRRTIRLFPALAFMLSVVSISIYYVYPQQYPNLALDLISGITYSTNWIRAYSWHEPNLYFGHTWSLAVEQQFYIIWPLILFVSLRSRYWLKTVLLVSFIIALASIFWRYYLISVDGISRIYFALDTRVDGLMFGCIMGITLSIDACQKQLEKIFLLMRYPAILFIFFLFFNANHADINFYKVYLPFLNLAACVVIGDICLNSSSWLGKVLGYSWIAEIGVLSYGIYLWHYPIFRVILDLGFNKSIIVFVFGGLLSTILAGISFYYIEKPIQKYFKKSQHAVV